MKEEHSLKVFGNSLLRKIFGQERDKIVEDWRKMHNEEVLHSSPHVN
jgi:hypothetical protein